MGFKIIVIGILIVISWVDIKKQEIPDSLSLGMIIGGIIYNGLVEGRLEDSVLGMGAYSLPFILVYGYFSRIFKKEALGFGDVKLSMGAGAVFTFTNFEKVYWLFSGSFILGGIYCIFFWMWKKILKENIEVQNFPFAPFISLTTIILMFYDKG